MRVRDFAGGHWRQGWVKGPMVLDEQSFPTASKTGDKVCGALAFHLLHCSSLNFKRTRLPAGLAPPEKATGHIFLKRSLLLKASYHQRNHISSQDLIKPAVILVASSPRGRGRVEPSPLRKGKDLDFRGT